jgi:magnesium transporter
MNITVIRKDFIEEDVPIERIDPNVCKEDLCLIIGDLEISERTLETFIDDKQVIREIKDYIEWDVDFFYDEYNERDVIIGVLAPEKNSDRYGKIFLITYGRRIIVLYESFLKESFVREFIKIMKRTTARENWRVINRLLELEIDLYQNNINILRERLEDLEDLIWESDEVIIKDRVMARKIFSMKRSIIKINKDLIRLRDLVIKLENSIHILDKDLINKEEIYYLRIEISSLIETLEILRDLMISMIDIDIAYASYKINQIMKKLTAITLILMPPTLIASIYGMNFDTSVSPWNMPELRLPYGYPMALIMIFISMWLPYLILRKIKFL